MRKVLFLGRFPPPVHGAALMNENYFKALSKDKNFKVKRIKINYSDTLSELGKVNLKKFFGFFIVFFKLFKELVFFRPKIIYFELAHRGFAFYRDSVYVILCKLFKRKIIFHFQAKGIKESSEKNAFTRNYYRFILRNTKAILLSNLLLYDLEGFVKKKDIFIVPNAIRDELTDKEFKNIIEKRSKNKKKVLLFLSNMIESKGPLDVLNICEALKKEGVEFICNFVGVFSDEKFKTRFFNEIKKKGLQKECFYLGPKYGKDKLKILEGTDYLIFPTNYENEVFPLVILEALMFGIPVFSYKNAAIPEIISKDYLGFVAKRKDWKSLFKNLYDRLGHKENALKIREEFKNKYLLSISVDKLRHLLK